LGTPSYVTDSRRALLAMHVTGLSDLTVCDVSRRDGASTL